MRWPSWCWSGHLVSSGLLLTTGHFNFTIKLYECISSITSQEGPLVKEPFGFHLLCHPLKLCYNTKETGNDIEVLPGAWNKEGLSHVFHHLKCCFVVWNAAEWWLSGPMHYVMNHYKGLKQIQCTVFISKIINFCIIVSLKTLVSALTLRKKTE